MLEMSELPKFLILVAPGKWQSFVKKVRSSMWVEKSWKQELLEDCAAGSFHLCFCLFVFNILLHDDSPFA